MAIQLEDLDSAIVKDSATGKQLMGVAIIAGEIKITAGDITVTDVTIGGGTVNVEPGIEPLAVIAEPGTTPFHAILDSGDVTADIPSRAITLPLGLVKVDSGKIAVEPGALPIHAIVDSGSITIQEPLDVKLQDLTNLIISSHLVRSLASTALAAEATVDTRVATLGAGHGFVNGVSGQILIIEGYYMGEVLSVAGNAITLDLPFNYTFPSGTAVTRANEYMNVDGSSVPLLYGFRAIAGLKFDIQSIKITIISSNVMDDSLFASIANLPVGLMCRIKKSATQYNNLFNIQCNKDFNLYGTLVYATKAPSGKYGLTFEYRIKDNTGVVARLDGDLGQQIELWVRDNLSTLGEIEASVMGHVVEA